MSNWLRLGRRVVSHHQLTLPITGSIADYPPGTRLPAPEMPDLSGLSPRQRRRIAKKWPMFAETHRVLPERMRDGYYRQSENDADL